MLWGRAAGRCEFEGCNKLLSKSPVTQETVNIAQNAHIWAFSADGPRGHQGVPEATLNSIDNLTLVCHACHRKIDNAPNGGRYTATLLQAMKTTHEQRIECVTGVDPSKKSHVLLYGANIDVHSSPLNFQEAAAVIFPDHYPAEARPIALEIGKSSLGERDEHFWEMESQHLRTRFEQRVRARVVDGEIEHLSVFGLAPQPLLILFGTLLCDIVKAQVHQLQREPPGWGWPPAAAVQPFIIQRPTDFSGPPALVLSLSATVTADRIESVLGKECAIWQVRIREPHNDFVKSREQLAQFRACLRPLFDQIKAAHGQKALLHVFPAMPVSLAIEFGRVRMPKADMPWCIYDQLNSQGGFVPALTIGD